LPTLGTLTLNGVMFKAGDDQESSEEETVVEKKVEVKSSTTVTTTTTITTNVSININVIQSGAFVVSSAPKPGDDDYGLPKPTGPKPKSDSEQLLIFEDLLTLPLYPKNVDSVRAQLDGGLYEDPMFTDKTNRRRRQC